MARCFGRAADRHEVLDLAHSVVREETRDEHVGIGQVELPGPCGHGCGQFKTPAAVLVQDRSENARRVERRGAMPVDGPGGSDKSDGMQVADQPMIRYRQIACMASHAWSISLR